MKTSENNMKKVTTRRMLATIALPARSVGVRWFLQVPEANTETTAPNCLGSLHVDIKPGDRASDCGGIMEPIAVWVRRDGEWAIVHRCKRCRDAQLQPGGGGR